MKTYGAMHLDGGNWIIDRVEPHVAIRLKQLFPRIPKAGVPPYTLPHTAMLDADLDWFLSRYPLAVASGDRAAMVDGRLHFEAEQAEMERILLPDYVAPAVVGLKPGQVIRPYQVQAIEILRRRHALLLGDEGGLGKTYTAAGFMCSEPRALPAAVVCDAHLQRQWKQKIEAFTTLRVHMITKGQPYDLPQADVYIFRVSQIAGWSNIFATGIFKAAIFDEPQNLRTGTRTAKGLAAKALSEHTLYHFGLTATPIYNYGDEMWNVMQFLDDQVLGPWEDFSREWCYVDGSHWRISDPKALGTYLREQHALLRRLKPDVGQDLPKVSRIIEYIDYDEKTVASIEALARTLAIKAKTGTFTERGMATRELDLLARQTTGVAKARAVAQFTRLMVDAGEPVVLFGWHREVYDIWLRQFQDLKPAMYTGSESTSRKDAEKQRFLDGDTNLMIVSLRSGAGLDELQHRASTVIFGELDWSPGIHQQCIWRLDREGQTKPVTAFFLVTDDGSDPPMMEVLGIKASEATQIVDPHLGVQVNEDDTGRMQKLVERYLSKKRGQTDLFEGAA